MATLKRNVSSAPDTVDIPAVDPDEQCQRCERAAVVAVADDLWCYWDRSAPILDGYVRGDGHQVYVWCDWCCRFHFHGHHTGESEECKSNNDPSRYGRCICPIGSGDGHRVAHCPTNYPHGTYEAGMGHGYYIREVGYLSELGIKAPEDLKGARPPLKRWLDSAWTPGAWRFHIEGYVAVQTTNRMASTWDERAGNDLLTLLRDTRDSKFTFDGYWLIQRTETWELVKKAGDRVRYLRFRHLINEHSRRAPEGAR